MEILLAGATGFIGRELVRFLLPHHKITVLGRNMQELKRCFPEKVNLSTWDMLSTLDANLYDVIINLSGKNIAASRWNEAVKKEIITSRVDTITKLTQWVIAKQAKPRFFAANAVGIYGLQEDNDISALDEDSFINQEKPKDYMSEIGIRWEQALQPAIDYGIPVTEMRFGVVLKKNEGMLKKLALSFQVGLGSIVGNGKQVLSWVHVNDVVHAIAFLLKHPELTGAFNITSPHPVTQKEFASTLAKVMHRPLFLIMPAFVMRGLFGEMADCLLLRGQRVLPKRLVEAGYVFQFPGLEDALHDTMNNGVQI